MASEATHEKVNILLVDDQESRLLTYDTILRDLEQNLVHAHSGFEALQCLMKQEFAVVLLDVSMPGMDGFQVMEGLKAIETDKDQLGQRFEAAREHAVGRAAREASALHLHRFLHRLHVVIQVLHDP